MPPDHLGGRERLQSPTPAATTSRSTRGSNCDSRWTSDISLVGGGKGGGGSGRATWGGMRRPPELEGARWGCTRVGRLRLIRVLVILVPTPISRRDDLFPAMTIDHLHQSTHGTETPATLPSGSQIGRRRHDARALRAVTDRALFAPSLCECSLCECSLCSYCASAFCAGASLLAHGVGR